MEMSIDEAKKELLKHKSPYYNCVADAEANEAIDIAVSTMRKYQKIEEIMHKVYASDNADVCLVQRLAEIRRVIADGKTD